MKSSFGNKLVSIETAIDLNHLGRLNLSRLSSVQMRKLGKTTTNSDCISLGPIHTFSLGFSINGWVRLLNNGQRVINYWHSYYGNMSLAEVQGNSRDEILDFIFSNR